MATAVAIADEPGLGRRPLDLYFQDLAGCHRLNPREEIELALELRAARLGAWEAFFRAPLGDVVEVAMANIDADRRPTAEAHKLARALADGAPAKVAVAIEAAADAFAAADRDGVAAAAVLENVVAGLRDPAVRRACEAATTAARRIRDRFVACNLGLVVVIARRYERRHLSLGDLIQEGNTGLLKAVDRFDPDRGFRFSTYAVWWIRHAIGRALSDKSREIRLPVHVAERQQTVLRARSTLEAHHGRPPTVPELAKATGFTEDKVEDLLSVEYTRAAAVKRGTQSMAPLEVEEIACSPELEDEALDADVLELGLRQAMRDLPAIQQDVLRRRFGLGGDEPMTLREVGEIHRLSRERIRQLQERALKALRKEFRRRGLD
jgi:RNA polymerase primary sigma factor